MVALGLLACWVLVLVGLGWIGVVFHFPEALRLLWVGIISLLQPICGFMVDCGFRVGCWWAAVWRSCCGYLLPVDWRVAGGFLDGFLWCGVMVWVLWWYVYSAVFGVLGAAIGFWFIWCWGCWWVLLAGGFGVLVYLIVGILVPGLRWVARCISFSWGFVFPVGLV